eukprot:10279816-Alexandrium_andersonii.AAC.1
MSRVWPLDPWHCCALPSERRSAVAGQTAKSTCAVWRSPAWRRTLGHLGSHACNERSHTYPALQRAVA